MPGFILNIGKDKLTFPEEVRKKLVINRMEGDDFQLERHVVNKFMNDRLFADTHDYIVVVEGIVLNNHELKAKYQSETWLDCVVHMYEKEGATTAISRSRPYCAACSALSHTEPSSHSPSPSTT